jgi:hypothetical protein
MMPCEVWVSEICMPNNADIRFIYRVRPLSSLIAYLFAAGVLIGLGIWAWIAYASAAWALLSLVLAFVALLRAVFVRTRTFIVSDDGLTVIKRPLIGLFGSFEFFQRLSIRKIRYRAERHVDLFDDDDEGPEEIRYILDLVTTDSQIVMLLMVTDFSFDRRLGRRLAVALHTRYEECLEDENGNPL